MMGPSVTTEDLLSLGASQSNIRWLTKPTAENIQYLDLIESVTRRDCAAPSIRPEAVVEFEGQPLLYVVDGRGLAGSVTVTREALAQTLRTLTLRGDPAYLAVLEFGRVVIHPIELKKSKADTSISWDTQQSGPRSLIQDLVAEAIEGLPGRGVRRAAVHELLFRLLTEAADALFATRALSGLHDDVLALIGRALFARFLIDREIMTRTTFPDLKDAPENCFSSSVHAARTCKWLDDTFNGELLPLANKHYQAYFKLFGDEASKVFHILSNVIHRAPGGQLTFESEWKDLDFAHVPIGLLSEVYERYAHRHIGGKAKKESMHYTPRHIAEFMIEEAFAGLESEQRRHARLLDPAAGGGVFLTLGFRKLVAALWDKNRRRPTRREIRRILYRQIRGFDINASALKLAALGLYLTAIELDPNPTDFDEIPFDPLFEPSGRATVHTVLTHARLPNESEDDPYVLGSLGQAISNEHRKKYDVVIGNPPWSGLSSTKGAKEVAKQFHEVVRDVARRRADDNGQGSGLLEIANSYENPDGVPDLPFVWRSMEWAVDGGIIALALHARLLFKQADMGSRAREALFTALRVTGVLNGAAVRKENVWPNVNAPWCLLFARNEVPADHDVFHFVSIELEKRLNGQGRLRIDEKSAQPIQFTVFKQKPYLLKTLFRGTAMDAAVMEHLAALKTISVGKYMDKHGLKCGEGYKVAEDSKQQDSSAMIGMVDLRREWSPRFAAGRDLIKHRFERRTLHRPRDIAIYRGPVVILPVSVPEDPDQGVGLISDNDVAYSESFNGYSMRGFKAGNPYALACYLHVLTYSKLFRYYVLMTSSQFGVERDSLQKEDVDEFPIIPFENLHQVDATRAQFLSEAIAREEMPWPEVDQFVFELYGISAELQNVITDTLSVSLPYPTTAERAERAPSEPETEAFRATLEGHLRPIFQIAGVDVVVKTRSSVAGSWAFLDVVFDGYEPAGWDQRWLSELADNQGASGILVPTPQHHIGVGLLAQYRYWTTSRARLCALTIIREYGDAVVAQGSA
ncbi:MAG: hypothetical protein CVU20_12680 [Betaproteobacteria bacterium HGW-Betaproteobacteria-14]|nr:MAG: hypothetical protein CVU20_12680 [Betaproteobacteria bacterium HGW-Betaproteobacteria-14]